MIYSNCTITEYYAGNNQPTSYECTVKIIEDKILVEYSEDSHFVQYEGTRDTQGNYKLYGKGFLAEATLNRIDENFYKGKWSQDGIQGTWEIELDE